MHIQEDAERIADQRPDSGGEKRRCWTARCIGWLGPISAYQWRHSMILSARTRIDCGTLTCKAFAVCTLTTSSNFVGCSIGRSPGLAPRMILSTYEALRRNRSSQSTEYVSNAPASAKKRPSLITGKR